LGLSRFYCDKIDKGQVRLDKAEAHHLINVMRLGAGEKIELFDGRGKLAKSVITEIKRKDVLVEVEEVQTFERRRDGRVVIAASIAKGQRFDMLISKCTELGADHIAAVVFERTARQVRGEGAVERYEKLSISAAKQCGRVFLPRITGPMKPAETISFLKNEYPQGRFIFGSLNKEAKNITETVSDGSDVIAFVGPEGGMSDAEERVLINQGAQGVRLTDTVLRIETAAMAFSAILCAGRSSAETI
jgi:16S rRNA (uracil1498-N3)-methyltransferase